MTGGQAVADTRTRVVITSWGESVTGPRPDPSFDVAAAAVRVCSCSVLETPARYKQTRLA